MSDLATWETLLAERQRNFLFRWFLEDDSGAPIWPRVVVVVGVLAGLVVLKRVAASFRGKSG